MGFGPGTSFWFFKTSFTPAAEVSAVSPVLPACPRTLNGSVVFLFSVSDFKIPFGAAKPFLLFYSRVSRCQTIWGKAFSGKSLSPHTTPPRSPCGAASGEFLATLPFVLWQLRLPPSHLLAALPLPLASSSRFPLPPRIPSELRRGPRVGTAPNGPRPFPLLRSSPPFPSLNASWRLVPSGKLLTCLLSARSTQRSLSPEKQLLLLCSPTSLKKHLSHCCSLYCPV